MAGFTLLEVLIAVAILSISLTSLLGSQMASLRATDQARMLSSVAFLAEGQLVEIEYELQQDGWGQDDQTFDGDFSEEGWPEIEYVCVVDLIELPEYEQLVQAKDASETDGDDFLQDAGDQAFGMLGMVWPIIKEAIEQSIRKAWCTVRWHGSGKRKRLSREWLCEDEENECLTIATFWTDPLKLQQLPSLGGGEVEEGEDDGGGGGGGDDDGGTTPGGGGRPGGSGRPGGGGAGGGSRPTINQGIPQGPGGRGGLK
ncbi:prepilin-type N-terminal cleavage/methylation domain-containing protein [Paraliomyxa miuraensis]|uniref:prepilin-type N-terminal cleavage/methylation domain-containing protein n=1 Tax=Paraliomyxa miuraensis TaxID=376150 RepID=UPI002250EAAF|nr:prepilin-type N-terminal cleavage/methylation domain-containing protein [Paraliomyxa miuraensis]MCX4242953.1 prepilin-type N-terminal cleavage/methylation domain-containing protein [Paraliomyxa miuraensis]